YEQLLLKYNDLIIDDTISLPGNFKGFYDNGVILIDKNLPETEKLEVLAEEIAHHKLTYGNIINQNTFLNRRYENYARRLAYKMLVPKNELMFLFSKNVKSLHEIASYFEVSPKFIYEALSYYNKKAKDAVFLFNI